MCLCNMKDFTSEERNILYANDYVFCQGFYNSLAENLKEYWLLHKQCCDRNNYEDKCEDKQCKKYI